MEIRRSPDRRTHIHIPEATWDDRQASRTETEYHFLLDTAGPLRNQRVTLTVLRAWDSAFILSLPPDVPDRR